MSYFLAQLTDTDLVKVASIQNKNTLYLFSIGHCSVLFIQCAIMFKLHGLILIPLFFFFFFFLQGIVGNLSSGKSALVHRYLTGTYVQEESPEGKTAGCYEGHLGL